MKRELINKSWIFCIPILHKTNPHTLEELRNICCETSTADARVNNISPGVLSALGQESNNQ
jgi:hypothetical protein